MALKNITESLVNTKLILQQIQKTSCSSTKTADSILLLSTAKLTYEHLYIIWCSQMEGGTCYYRQLHIALFIVGCKGLCDVGRLPAVSVDNRIFTTNLSPLYWCCFLITVTHYDQKFYDGSIFSVPINVKNCSKQRKISHWHQYININTP